MKKLSMAMAAVMLFASCACFTANAEGGMIIKATPEKDTITSADTTLAVSVDFEGNTEGFNTIGFEVAYPEGFTFVDGAIDEAYEDTFWLSLGGYEGPTYVIVDDAENSIVKIVAACLYNIEDESGTLFNLNFAVDADKVADENTFTVTVMDSIFEDNGEVVAVDIENGTVTYEDGDIGLLGDVDGNGIVNSVDASLVLQHFLGKSTVPLTAAQLAVADVDGNGIVNSVDAANILQIFLGR